MHVLVCALHENPSKSNLKLGSPLPRPGFEQREYIMNMNWLLSVRKHAAGSVGSRREGHHLVLGGREPRQELLINVSNIEFYLR